MSFVTRPTVITIDLGAAAANMRAICGAVGPQTKVAAVVKANAYGHGAVEIARTALKNGASSLAVAIPEEGVELREAGITAPVHILGTILPEEAELVVRHDLQPTVCSMEVARALNAAAAAQDKWLPVHLKLDTGMGRIGVREDRELDHFLDDFKRLRSVGLYGVFTHFANSDGADKGFALEQYRRFTAMVARIRRAGFDPMLHAANSAAIADLPETHLDMVRAGIMLYGYYPSSNVRRDIPITPVMSLTSKVVYLKTLPAGVTVSYDRTYTTWRPTRVATIPVGYGDGYKRLLSNRGAVLLHGRRAPILGRICMDQCMVDVTEIPDVAAGDEVVLLGRQGKDHIDAEEIAAWAETISYEIPLSFTKRIPRVYVED